MGIQIQLVQPKGNLLVNVAILRREHGWLEMPLGDRSQGYPHQWHCLSLLLILDLFTFRLLF